MKLPSNVVNLFNSLELVSFGTADKNGNPNVNAVFWKKVVDDETILLISKFMKMTKANLLENNQVCLSFWDSKTEEGYKLKGFGTFYESGEIFDQGKSYLQSKQPDYIPAGVVEIKVKEVYSLKPGPEAGKKIC